VENLVTPARSDAGRQGTAEQVVRSDLDEICARLAAELQELSGQTLLITGGAGFLGHYLVQVPLHWNRNRNRKQDPIRVVVCDNFLRGVPRWLEDRRNDPNLELVEHDVTRPLPADITEPDYIIHAASVASPTYYRQFPSETMDANVAGVRLLLDHCVERARARDPVEGFLFFSSSEIYGDPDPSSIPTPETYRGLVSSTGPRACYDESKRYGETLCVNFARVHEVPVKIVRPFNNYGPGLGIRDRRVIPDFARDILEGRDVVLHSDGSPTRTFCYVADAVTGYYQALMKGRSGEAYNIGVEHPEVSMAELARRMTELGAELFAYRGSVVRQASEDPEYLTDNPVRRCPDVGKARSELGYDPRVGLDEGLRRSMCWYAGQWEEEAAAAKPGSGEGS
jgi:UDP-glucuronate decarboxylase